MFAQLCCVHRQSWQQIYCQSDAQPFVSFLGHAHAVTWLPIATKPSFLPSVVDVFVESSNVISVVASGKVLSDRARSSVATRFNWRNGERTWKKTSVCASYYAIRRDATLAARRLMHLSIFVMLRVRVLLDLWIKWCGFGVHTIEERVWPGRRTTEKREMLVFRSLKRFSTNPLPRSSRLFWSSQSHKREKVLRAKRLLDSTSIILRTVAAESKTDQTGGLESCCSLLLQNGHSWPYAGNWPHVNYNGSRIYSYTCRRQTFFHTCDLDISVYSRRMSEIKQRLEIKIRY